MSAQSMNPSLALSILDALDNHLVVLDNDGVIIHANRAWNDFAASNPREDGEIPSHVGIGANYLDVSQMASGPSAENAQAAYRGIKEVLAGKTRQFILEYACHSPAEQRWFVMKVTPLRRTRPRQVVVVHTNVTALKQAEYETQCKMQELTRVLENLEIFAGQLKGTIQLEQSIRVPQSGNSAIQDEVRKETLSVDTERLKLLSKREKEVLLSLTRGERNTEIAARLGLSVKSVSTYRSRVLEKLQVKSTAELVSFMHRTTLA